MFPREASAVTVDTSFIRRMPINMITLETEFTSGSGGFIPPLKYKQLQRNGIYAMYQRFNPDGVVKDIEVIVINTVPKGTIQKFPGGVVKVTEDDAEHYATTSFWGKKGWSFHGINAIQGATAKLNELVNEPNKTPTIGGALTIPVVEFTTKELSELNKIDYASAVIFIKEQLGSGAIKFVREERRNVKGKASKVFSKTS